MDVSIVKKVGRIKFIRLIGKYKNGTHLDTKLGKEIVTYKKCRKVSIKSKEKFNLCLDGEILNTDNAYFRLIPRGIRFSFPKGIENI